MNIFDRRFFTPHEHVSGDKQEKGEVPPTIKTQKKELKKPVDDEKLTQVLGYETEADLRSKLVQQSLQDSYNIIYATRPQRDVDGQEGIIVRAVGEIEDTISNTEDDAAKTLAETAGWLDPETYRFRSVYYDTKRGKWVDTEWKEFIDYSRAFKQNPTAENAINMLLEVGDILFQITALEMRLKTVVDRLKQAEILTGTEVLDLTKSEGVIRSGIEKLISIRDTSVKPILELHGLDYALAQRLVRIKYGIRSSLQNNGYEGKAPKFETLISKAEYEMWGKLQKEEKPDVILAGLETKTYEELIENFLKKDLKEVVLTKYGTPISEQKEKTANSDYRERRNLDGPGGIAHRIFGQESPKDEIKKERKGDLGIMVETDYGQFYAALEVYDAKPNQKNLVLLLRRAATFTWQLSIVNEIHTESNDRGMLITLIKKQMEINAFELKNRGIDHTVLDDVTRVIFGSRSIIEKQVPFEEKLIETHLQKSGYLKKWHKEQGFKLEMAFQESDLRARYAREAKNKLIAIVNNHIKGFLNEFSARFEQKASILKDHENEIKVYLLDTLPNVYEQILAEAQMQPDEKVQEQVLSLAEDIRKEINIGSRWENIYNFVEKYLEIYINRTPEILEIFNETTSTFNNISVARKKLETFRNNNV